MLTYFTVGEQSEEHTLTLTPVIWVEKRIRSGHKWKCLEARSTELFIGSEVTDQ